MKCWFRKGKQTGPIQKTVELGSGLTMVDAVNGKFAIDGFQIDWVTDTYYYDIPTTFTGAIVRTYIKGVIKVKQNITE